MELSHGLTAGTDCGRREERGIALREQFGQEQSQKTLRNIGKDKESGELGTAKKKRF